MFSLRLHHDSSGLVPSHHLYLLFVVYQIFCLGILFGICSKTFSRVEWITEQWEKDRATAGSTGFGYLVLTLMYFSIPRLDPS